MLYLAFHPCLRCISQKGPPSQSQLSLRSFVIHTLLIMGLMIKKPEHVAGSAAPAIIVGLFVAFGGVLFG